MDKRNRNIALSAVVMGFGMLFAYLIFGEIGFFIALACCVAIFLAYAIPEHRAYTTGRATIIVMLRGAFENIDGDEVVYENPRWGPLTLQELLAAVKKETYPGQDYIRAYLQNH